MRPRVGISSCLLGQEVRWDGRHRRSEAVLALARQVEWVPVCPEVEVGMGVPREPVRLVGPRERPRMIARSGADWTDRMEAWAEARLDALGDLDGYVLKAGSPSCGLAGVPIAGEAGGAPGAGLFCAALRRRHPALPVAEETSLADEHQRERFLAEARARARARARPRR
ncbi:MAG TPA: DUF523 domain-containing protein [Kofleriaceae bacterium]|nr:DUF523 domain-containing protein [Kofleriaceae bacterium]